MRTADVDDFIANLRKPHIPGRRKTPRTLKPASINRTIEILRHMMNWASAASTSIGRRSGAEQKPWFASFELKGHDVTPVWKSYNWTTLTQDCHAEFRRIDLRWHDLRHEYASRLVEKNVPLAQVRDLLGHTSIMTTERYDNQKLENLQAAAARLERGEIFTPPPPTPVDARGSQSFRLKAEATSVRSKRRSPSNRQDFVKSWGDQDPEPDPGREPEASTNSHADQDLEGWLGGRDSNPDNVVQSHVSYR